MLPKRWMWIAWPAFLVAGVLEFLVFAMVDPQDLHWFGQPVALSRQGVYTLAFFVVCLGACLGAPRTKERLTAQIEEARRLGVQSTPTLYINGKKLPRINDFLQVVDKEAQAKGFPPLQPSAAPH